MVTTYFEEQTDKNSTLSVKKFSERRGLILNSMESMHAYREEFNWILGNTYLSNLGHAETPIFSALIKNEYALYSCLRLTDLGLYGSARTLLRSVFEALMIAKFASVSQSEEFIEKWKSGQTIYFSNAILKKIEKPELDEINTLWRLLCEFSHATIYAQQVDLDFENIEKELSINYSLIMIFLCWEYHLLSRHFVTSSMEYYTSRYRQDSDLKYIKAAARESIDLIKKPLTKSSKKVIREYVAAWKLTGWGDR
jgi:hypothetical protein